MIAVCFLACLAVASAAPQYRHYGSFGEHHHGSLHSPPPQHEDYSSEIFTGELFDARRFWSEMAAEMHRFDQMMSEFYKHFPASSSETGIQGNEYIVTVNMNGFDENDIKVKAREGVLMVQAVHKSDDGSERSYLDLKTLPSYVNPNGSWTYNTGTLKIVFSINNKPEDVTEAVIGEAETEAPNTEDRDREEMEPNHTNTEHEDADIGLEGGNKNEDTEILTNVISRQNPVEATTYAVDLKNEVEFVPVKY